MNAAVALGVPPTAILQHTDTVSVCLSKVGLKETRGFFRLKPGVFTVLCVTGTRCTLWNDAGRTSCLYIPGGEVP